MSDNNVGGVTNRLSFLFGQNDAVNGAKKLVWLLAALISVTLIIMFDYFIYYSNGTQERSGLLPKLPAFESHKQMDGDKKSSLMDLYANYDNEKVMLPEQAPESTSNIEHMPLEEQLLQTGLLSRLYIDDGIYRLSGIVKSGIYGERESQKSKYKAILSVVYADAIKGGGKQVEGAEFTRDTRVAIRSGDTLGAYIVESVDSKRLVLAQGERRLWLELFVSVDKQK